MVAHPADGSFGVGAPVTLRAKSREVVSEAQDRTACPDREQEGCSVRRDHGAASWRSPGDVREPMLWRRAPPDSAPLNPRPPELLWNR